MRRKLFDLKCGNLAHDFIDDHPHLRPMAADLAMSIQATIDIWIEEQNALRAIDTHMRLLTEA